MIGIYTITNALTGQRYIGRSVRIEKRLYGHLRLLRLGKHENPYLQRSFAKYGEYNFTLKPLIVCRREDLPFYERLLIEGFRSDERKFGFNLTFALAARLTHTNRARDAISAFQKVYQNTSHYEMTPEIREKIASTLRGRVGCNKGRKYPPEVRAKMGAPKGNKNRLRKNRAPEDRARIAESLQQYHREHPEAGERLASLNRSRKEPDEQFAKRVKAIKEAWRDPELRAARAEAMRERWKDPEYVNKVMTARRSKKKCP